MAEMAPGGHSIFASELVARFEQGGSPELELDKVLTRIGSDNAIYNSFVLVDTPGARQAAARSAARWRAGTPLSPMDGVPVTVKDMLPVEGLPSRGGSLATPDTPAPRSAPAVHRLLNAGAVLVGLTTTAEFGGAPVTISPLTGVTRNARDPSRTAGGSSGGAAVSVAAGFCAAALATDTGGSIRVPAALNGVVGLKPTGGRIPTDRGSVLHTMGCPGPIANNVADCARLFGVIADARFDPSPSPATAQPPVQAVDLREITFVASRTLGFASWIDPEIDASFTALIHLLRGLGCQVDEVEPPWSDPSGIFLAYTRANYAHLLSDLDEQRLALLSPQVRDARAAGLKLSVVDLLKARAQREAFARQVQQLFLSDRHILLTPMTSVTAFDAEAFTPSHPQLQHSPRAWTPFGNPFNLSRHPALTMPCGTSTSGLPIACQLVAGHWQEPLLLQVAQKIEEQLIQASTASPPMFDSAMHSTLDRSGDAASTAASLNAAPPPTTSVNKARLQVRVHAIHQESDNVVSVDLRAFDNGREAPLPPFTPGAHIDLHLPVGVRSYSLTNSPTETHRYVVAVGLPENSRGGSAYVHRELKAGADIEISSPRNMFPLVDADGPVCLIAGGIGITPIRCMFNALREAGREVTLLYCARSRQTAAFAAELADQPGVRFHFDNEAGGPADLDQLMAKAPPSTHFYCCGPSPMLSAYEQAGARQSIAPGHIHLERFSPAENAPAVSKEDDGVFTVELSASGMTVDVLPGQSLLDALLDAGADAPYSCREGICGACETTVLDGTPDHRCSVLSDAEKLASKTMMICVSRCAGKRLVLDL